MSRLRRLVVSDRWFFVTCRLLPRRRILSPSEFATLAAVVGERRAEHDFLLTAWVFLPDYWHAIFYPRRPLTISRVMEAIRDGATKRINRSRREGGVLWQPRFPSAQLRAGFDRALRTVKEYNERVNYIHLNPVKAGLVDRADDWAWSSVHDYTGNVNDAPVTASGLGEAAEERRLRVPLRYPLRRASAIKPFKDVTFCPLTSAPRCQYTSLSN